jgi:hypothetical protein
MKYKILKYDNPFGRVKSSEIYEAHIAVINGVLEKNHTPFTAEQLWDITNGWRNMDLINYSNPEMDYSPKTRVSKYLLIRR